MQSNGAIAGGDGMFAVQEVRETRLEFFDEAALGRDPIGPQAFVDISNLGFRQFRRRDHVFHKIPENLHIPFVP